MSCLYALPTGNRFSQGLHFNEQQQLNVAVNACQLYSGTLLKSKNTHGNMRSVFIQAGRSIQLQCMGVEHIYMLQAISSCASSDVHRFGDARGQLLDCTLSSARSLDATFYMHDRGLSNLLGPPHSPLQATECLQSMRWQTDTQSRTETCGYPKPTPWFG